MVSRSRIRHVRLSSQYGDACHVGGYKYSTSNDPIVIEAHGFTIDSPRNEFIEGLFMGWNEQVDYLPENISERFPNLVVMDAVYSSINSISKANFVNLTSLQRLYLRGNRIQRIDDDTFSGLISLTVLELSEILKVKSDLMN